MCVSFCHPTTQISHSSKKHTYPKVHCSAVYNSQDTEQRVVKEGRYPDHLV